MTAQRIRISSRQVHELLAGEVTYEEFASSLGWARKRNPFAKALNDGRMIGAVGVTSGGDADDDWLEFLFGDPDPAIARLKYRDKVSAISKTHVGASVRLPRSGRGGRGRGTGMAATHSPGTRLPRRHRDVSPLVTEL